VTTSRRVGVLLKGGLGNQLFQIAAGIYASQDQSFEIYSKFTNPRETLGICDAFYFDWPDGVIENAIPSSRFEKKLLAMSLSTSIVINKTILQNLLHRTIFWINALFFSVKFRKPTKIISGEGTGFSPIKLSRGNNLLNGYFQAHQYPINSIAISRLREIRIKSPSVNLEAWIQKAKKEKPVFVHLRLGDYKQEYGIGVLPKDYYQKALAHLTDKGKSKNIWIFTNEPESVNEFITPDPSFEVRVLGNIGLNPAETLELMRFGTAYVIANSTYSWWGAFLAYDSECIRIMPKPWFQLLPSPRGINPKNWIEIEYFLEEDA
jgi:hypothetical protein